MDGRAPIRVGIVGFGTAGEYFHGYFLAADPAYEIVGVVTGNPQRTERVRALAPGAKVVPDLERLLALSPDLVVVASPPKAHQDNVIRALRAGSAVVVDKPVAPSAEAVEAMIAVSRETGSALTVYQNRRWDRDFRTLRRLLGEGKVGTPHTFESRFEWFRPDVSNWKGQTTPEDGGGSLLDLGPHLVDQAILLLGPVRSVDYASLRILRRGGRSDDDAFVCLTHASGAVSRLSMGSFVGLEGPRLRLSGSEGTLAIDGKDQLEAALRYGGARPSDDGIDVDTRHMRFAAGGDVEELTLDRGSYAEFYAAVARSLRDGSPMPVDPADSLEVMRILEEVRRVADTQDDAGSGDLGGGELGSGDLGGGDLGSGDLGSGDLDNPRGVDPQGITPPTCRFNPK